MDGSAKHPTNGNEDEMDVDAVLAELEAEEDGGVSSLREQRVREMESTFAAKTTTTSQQDVYITLKSDDDTLRYTTEHEKAIVHFFHPEFARCSVMDEHLALIAQTHREYGTDSSEEEVKFARVDVKHAEFVVQKLGVRVLPCVIGFVKGQIKGRIVGFEGVAWGGKESGPTVTRAIEEQFMDWKVLRRALFRQRDDDRSESDEERTAGPRRKGITGRKQNTIDVDDDWD